MELLVVLVVVAVVVWYLSSRSSTTEAPPLLTDDTGADVLPNPAVTRSGEAVATTVFGRSSEISSGKEGKIFEIPQHRLSDVEGRMVFKRLTEPDHDVRAQFDALSAFLAARSTAARDQLLASTAWPLQLAVDGGIPIGYVMRRASERHRILVTGPKGRRETLADMPYLACDDIYLRNRQVDPLPNPDDRMAVLGELAAVLAVLHEGGAVYGDLSLVNAAYSIRPASVFLLDCDSIRVPGSPASLRQLDALDYIPPEGGTPTTASDVYKFGCLAQDVLSQPLHAPSEVDRRRRAVDLLPAAGKLLLERSLASDPAHRPTIREWADLLSSGSHAPPPPPAPGPAPPPAERSEAGGWVKDAQGRWVRAGAGAAPADGDGSAPVQPPSTGWVRDPTTGEWRRNE
jgi:hypothetical protein